MALLEKRDPLVTATVCDDNERQRLQLGYSDRIAVAGSCVWRQRSYRCRRHLRLEGAA